MTTYLTLVLLVSVIALAVGLGTPSITDYDVAERGRPRELKGARVVLPGAKLAMTAPFACHGEPDVIYLARGTLIVREDKTGRPSPESERIQMSVYAACLRHNPPEQYRGYPVAPFGYVRYGIPGKTRVRWAKVRLYSDLELARLVEQYWAAQNGDRAVLRPSPHAPEIAPPRVA